VLRIDGAPYDFSFSGVKSAVLNYINGCKMKGLSYSETDIAASFQQAVVDVLVNHTMLAAKDYGIKKVAIAGGVACNSGLREGMKEACKKTRVFFLYADADFVYG